MAFLPEPNPRIAYATITGKRALRSNRHYAYLPSTFLKPQPVARADAQSTANLIWDGDLALGGDLRRFEFHKNSLLAQRTPYFLKNRPPAA